MFNGIKDWLVRKIGSVFGETVGSIVVALLLLIVALLVAALVKTLVSKLLNSSRIKAVVNKMDSPEKPGGTAQFICKLVYLLVFLLFVPAILGALHADSISSPIKDMIDTVWGYLPNVIAAIIVLTVGFFVARLVRQLLIPLFQRINVDRIQEKAGVEVPDSAKLSTTLAYIAYVLIVIPVVIVALKVLKIESISDPAVAMLSKIIAFIPNIIVAMMIITIGYMIARFGGQIVEQLIASTGVDAKLRKAMGNPSAKFALSKVARIVLQTLIIIFFVVEGVNLLGLTVLKDIGATIIRYLPNVLAASIIFLLAVVLSRLAENALKKTSLGGYSILVKGVIFAAAGFMILTQLGIASQIVTYAFIGVLAALAVAFAVSFGIGGREFAAKTLENLSKKVEEKNQGSKN